MASYGSGAVTNGAAGGYAGDPGEGTGVSGPRRSTQNGQNSDADRSRYGRAASVAWRGWTTATRRAGMAGTTPGLRNAADERSGARTGTVGGAGGIHASDRRNDARATRESSEYRFTSGDGQRDTATSGDTLPITRFRDRS